MGKTPTVALASVFLAGLCQALKAGLTIQSPGDPLPLGVLVPVITAAHWASEIWFCKKWAAHFKDEVRAPRMLWDLKAGAEGA